MATTTSIPPAVAAFFARRVVTPARIPAAPARRAEPEVALAKGAERPQRMLRRGSLLDLLV